MSRRPRGAGKNCFSQIGADPLFAELEALLAGNGFRLKKTSAAGAGATISIFSPGGA